MDKSGESWINKVGFRIINHVSLIIMMKIYFSSSTDYVTLITTVSKNTLLDSVSYRGGVLITHSSIHFISDS